MFVCVCVCVTPRVIKAAAPLWRTTVRVSHQVAIFGDDLSHSESLAALLEPMGSGCFLLLTFPVRMLCGGHGVENWSELQERSPAPPALRRPSSPGRGGGSVWLCRVPAGVNTNPRLQLCRSLPPLTALNGPILFACVR